MNFLEGRLVEVEGQLALTDGDLLSQQRVHRVPARCAVEQGTGVAAAPPPAMHPGVGDLP